MASVSAFIDMVKEFITELDKVFEDKPKLKIELERVNTLSPDDAQAFIESFAKSMEVSGKYITAKNPKIFKRGRAELFDNIELYKLWKEITRKSVRDAIWSYLQTLQILSTTITSLPKDLMSSIEKMAEECASKMVKENKGGGKQPEFDINNIDMNALMKSVQGIMGSIDMEKMGDFKIQK